MDKLSIKLQWLDYLNHNWLKEDVIQSLHDRTQTKKLHNNLIQNKELSFITNSTLFDQDLHLSHFEKNSPSLDEQKHYVDALLSNQVSYCLIIGKKPQLDYHNLRNIFLLCFVI